MKNIYACCTAVLLLCMIFGNAQASPDEPNTWEEVRFGGTVSQELDNSCGFASVLTIMRTHFGDERYDERTLLKKYMEDANESAIAEAMKNGLSLLEIEKLVQSLGYKTLKKILTLEELEQVTAFVPALVYLEVGKFRHFAVVRGVSREAVLLADPSRGNVEYSREEFLSEWKTLKGYPARTGSALVIVQPEGEFTLKLLKQPDEDITPSFALLQRQMRW